MPCHGDMVHNTLIAIFAETVTLRVPWLKLSKWLQTVGGRPT